MIVRVHFCNALLVQLLLILQDPVSKSLPPSLWYILGFPEAGKSALPLHSLAL